MVTCVIRQEKIIQRRSRHLRQLQEKGQKDRFLENKSIQELLAKAHISNEKTGKKCEKDMGKCRHKCPHEVIALLGEGALIQFPVSSLFSFSFLWM